MQLGIKEIEDCTQDYMHSVIGVKALEAWQGACPSAKITNAVRHQVVAGLLKSLFPEKLLSDCAITALGQIIRSVTWFSNIKGTFDKLREIRNEIFHDHHKKLKSEKVREYWK